MNKAIRAAVCAILMLADADYSALSQAVHPPT